MSIPLPLTVRLANSRMDRHVTNEVRDLSFREAVPGGFASARISLHRSLNIQPDDIDYFTRVYVYYNSQTVWEGVVEDPARSAGSDGEVFDLTCIGPAARVNDRVFPLILIDSRLDAWTGADNQKPGFENALGPVPFNDPAQGLILRQPQGLTTNLNDGAAFTYQPIRYVGQTVARLSYHVNSGGANANWVLAGILGTDTTIVAGDNADQLTMTDANAGDDRVCVVVSDFTNGRNCAFLWFVQTAGGTVTAANDLHWAAFSNVIIRAILKDASGSNITTGYSNSYVLAHEVVTDLLGRVLTMFDGANAVISTASSYQITQLAYEDGASAGTVLGDLMTLLPTYYWAAWETNPATNKYRFEWSVWPTTVRYETSIEDGFDSPGSAADIYNAVRIRYVDTTGKKQTTSRTSTVTVLTNAGLTREAFIDLGDNIGTTAAAQQVGDQFLTEHQVPPNAGTLTVARRIIDLERGCMVWPWEIQAGHLIRVRGVRPTVDGLNAVARDGVTVFRIVAREFSASDCTATLELDSFPATLERQVTEVEQRHKRRRRR